MSRVDADNEATYEVCVIPSDLNEACTPKTAILEQVRKCRFSKEATFAIKLALEEAISNAIKHGNRNDPSKTITVRYAVTEEKVVVIVVDEGGGFLPDEVPDCTCPERLSIPSGRGILLMQAYMDEVCYRRNGREVRFVKRRT